MVAGDDKQSSSGLEFKLHPLVLINISDHFTRFKANAAEGSPAPVVMGCLLGQQDGRCVDVCNSFEMRYTAGDDGWEVDHPFVLKKQEQYKTVFPKQDVVGWYCTGTKLEEQHMAVHRQMMHINEGPVFLLLNPFVDHSRKDLPVDVYETEMHVLDGAAQTIFVKANFSMETSDAERIGVDQVAKIVPSGGRATGTEQLTAHLSSLHSAIKMLCGKLAVIQEHMEQLASGSSADYPHEFVRQVNSLVGSLPALDNPAFKREYLLEYNDTLATLLLASVTQSLNGLSELTDKYGVALERTARRGRGGSSGMMMASMYGA